MLPGQAEWAASPPGPKRMNKTIALIGCWTFIVWLLALDTRRREGVSKSLWIVVAWVAIIGSRSVSSWFGLGGAHDQAQTYDQGNPIERMVYFLLIGAGVMVLIQRKVSLARFFRQNQWVTMLFGFWLLSLAWSDAPLIGFKRWFKDVGNLVMVLVILTESRPLDAIKAVYVRCACLLIPLSVLFIRFIPELGRTYHSWSGMTMYTGVADGKNTLGALVLTTGLVVLWDFVDKYIPRTKRMSWVQFGCECLLMMMCLYVLYVARSATSLACAMLGVTVFFFLRLPMVRRRLKPVLIGLAMMGGTLVVADLAFGIREEVSKLVIESLDRDPTLTGRTDAWPILIEAVEMPLLGTGYNSFWSGERLERMWEHYNIIQAHSGYVETYLNGGFLGIVFLGAFLTATGRRIYLDLMAGTPYAVVRVMFFLIAIVHNLTEASYHKQGILWFTLLLVSIRYPRRLGARSPHRQQTTVPPVESEFRAAPAPSVAPCG